MLSFVESMLSNNSSYEIHPSPAKSHRIIADNFFIACQHPASIAEYPSQDRLLLIRQFFQGLLGTLFRITFAELSRKYPNPQTPAISRGRIRGKANTRSLGVWLSQSLTFGSLAAASGACFLGLQKATSDSTRWQVQGWASRPWYLAVAKPCRSLTFGSLAATYGAVPFSCRTPGGRRW